MAHVVDHLNELRKRVLIALSAVLGSACVAYFFTEPLITFLTEPIRSQVQNIYFFSPQGAFFVRLKTAIFAGFLLALPIVISQSWFFISPGLLKKEKRFLVPLTCVTSVLFLVGAVFAFKVVIPFVLQFLLGFSTDVLKPMISVSEYLGFLISLMVAFGAAFNLPVVISFLVLIGVLNTGLLKKYRPHAVVMIFIAAAFLTPPDLVSQCLLAIPLMLLYELSVIASMFIKQRKAS